MAGAIFVRADLHVHTFVAPGEAPRAVAPTPELVVRAGAQRGISVIGVTDHNSAQNARAAVALASPTLLVLPGIEISTADGHLLGLFAPGAVDDLEDLARPDVLKLRTVSADGTQRSTRSMVEMVQEIGRRGGIAIAAHIDTADSLLARANNATLADLLAQRDLAGIEITNPSNASVFTAQDPVAARRQFWFERLKTLGVDASLARVMSTDAHSPTDVGADRTQRVLTRLRIDELNFAAVRSAIRVYPDARCRIEANVDVQYPRLTRASFKGGFLDGLTIDLSANLNCLIGGRGSGKSTCLRSIRAALAGTLDPSYDAAPNMPDFTEVEFVDGLGTRRRAGRRRYETSFDADSPTASISLPFVDLEQDFGGELLREDPNDPLETLQFIDRFVPVDQFDTEELDLLTRLQENGENLRQKSVATKQLKLLRDKRAKADRSLSTATDANLAKVAEYARILAAEAPLIDELERELDEAAVGRFALAPDLAALASQYGVDLSRKPAEKYAADLRSALRDLDAKIRTADAASRATAKTLVTPAKSILVRWKRQHASWEREIAKRRAKLQGAGLTLQVEQLDSLRIQLKSTDNEIRKYEEWERAYAQGLSDRKQLIEQLAALRDRRVAYRKAASDRLVERLNANAPGSVVSIRWVPRGMRRAYAERLGQLFELRTPRKERLAAAIDPNVLAQIGWRGQVDEVRDVGAPERFFDDAVATLATLRQFDVLFELETMDLGDRVEISVRFADDPPGPGRPFRDLSLGQLRSVLLGFCWLQAATHH